MTLKEAIKKCKEKTNWNMKKGNLYETRLWNKYREQLEIIEIVLTAKKLTKQDLKP